MSGNLGSRLLIAAALVFAIAPRSADAQVSDAAQCGTQLPACTTLRTNCCTRDFVGSSSQKAILIPMDRCHQQIANGGANAPTTSANAPSWCADNPGTSTNAMNRAYGLVYRLMQNNIPVYWIVNPTKSAPTNIVNNNNTTPATTPDARTKDVDFWVLSATGSTPTPTTALTNLAGTTPIKLMTLNNPGTATAALVASTNYSKNEFPVRGGAFLIAPDDRAAFDNFHKTQLGRVSCGTTGRDCYDFRDVWYYEVDPSAVFVWQDFTKPLSGGKYVEFQKQLPVAMRVDYEPPKVAVVSSGTLLPNFLSAAAINDLATGCAAGVLPAKSVGCSMNETDVQSNALITGGFTWLWLEKGSPSNCVLTNQKIRAFMTAGVGTYTAGNTIYFDGAISGFAEGCLTDLGTLGLTGTGLGVNNGAINETSANPLIVRYPSNLFSQYGDLDLNFSSGTVTYWDRVSGATSRYSATYNTAPVSLRRLMTYESNSNTDCSNHKDVHVVGAASSTTCDDASVAATADIQDMFSYGRYLNNSLNGVIFYSPGNNLTPGGQQAQLRMVLSSLIAMPPFIIDQTYTNIEVTRADPIIGSVGPAASSQRAIIQGTYEYRYDVGSDGVQRTVPRNAASVFVPDDIAGFTFPATKGHLRATKTASVTTAAEALNDNSGSDIVFDAGDSSTIPTVSFTGCAFPATGSCRNVWTTTQPGYLATNATERRVTVSDSNATVGTAMLPNAGTITYSAANKQDFIQRIMKGWDPNNSGTRVAQLGGIDRSTVAVIGPSPSYGSRPTIGYVGSTDGMLHAICMNDVSPCTPGMELWSYIPRVNLPNLRYNTARIDSSPRVLDVRANFYGTGTSIYTVLLFEAGNRPDTEDEVPAIYALDVSDPTRPNVLWEHATWDSSGTGTVFAPTLAACSSAVSCGRQTYTAVQGVTPLAASATARGTYALGEGLYLAAGQATIAGVTKNIVVAQTNNGGTGPAANVLTAIDIETGARVWQRVNKLDNFIAPRVAATINVPATGIPGGAVGIDKTLAGSNGFMTDIVAGDLYGNLWLVDPADGTSQVLSGANDVPLFQFTTDYHPIARPAIYAEGTTLYAVFATGGYADYSTNTLWGSNTTTQYVIGVDLDQTAGLPLTQLSPVGSVPINIPLVNLGNGFSQPRIIGTEVFVTTDTSNVNAATFGSSGVDTGFVTGFNFGTNVAITNIGQTRTGASALINDALAIFSSSGSKRQRLLDSGTGTAKDAASQTGVKTTAAREVTKTLRKLWLRTE